MGQRISYLKNTTSKSLKELMVLSYSSFCNRYLQENGREFEDNILTGYFQSGLNDNFDFETTEANVIDKMAEYFVNYYSHGEYCLFEGIGSSINLRSYESSSGMVLATHDKELIKLWDIVLYGRSIKDGYSRRCCSIDGCVGYLTPIEQKIMKEKIELYFGDANEIQKRYNTDKEWKNSVSTGLECVLDVLMPENELIIEIGSL